MLEARYCVGHRLSTCSMMRELESSITINHHKMVKYSCINNKSCRINDQYVNLKRLFQKLKYEIFERMSELGLRLCQSNKKETDFRDILRV